MYHVECIDIHKSDKMYQYIDRACLCANNMYNVANFHIRNLMTGLKKDISLHKDFCRIHPRDQLLLKDEALRKDLQGLPGQESFCSLTQD